MESGKGVKLGLLLIIILIAGQFIYNFFHHDDLIEQAKQEIQSANLKIKSADSLLGVSRTDLQMLLKKNAELEVSLQIYKNSLVKLQSDVDRQYNDFLTRDKMIRKNIDQQYEKVIGELESIKEQK
ncbi:MAG: hypothetical protein LWX56_02115 [Ignavibacteria bacterium]|nr:hypothetical protein [Ignavibacteria bacterium]